MGHVLRKVLYICHDHPDESPGGAQIVAYQLYEAIRDAGDFEPVMVSRVRPSADTIGHDAARFALAGRDPNIYHLRTAYREFDRLLLSAHAKRLYTEDWRGFLTAIAPDVVHFRHAMWLGYDMLRETRQTLPDVPIVYTLHEFVSICHHHGQMVRVFDHAPCTKASPQRCHECFPEVSPQQFFVRERFIKSALEVVDMFIAPSRHLRQRYIEWGIPPEKIRYEDTGLVPRPVAPDPPDAGRRRRIGFFAAMTPYKGFDVLLEAMKILQARSADVQLVAWVANLEVQRAEFQDRVRTLLEDTADTVVLGGRYEQSELPALLGSVDWSIVPSVWWEVGPNSVREAMMYRRPVICSDIGAMAERVADGVNGLRFRVGDPVSLADTIQRAVDDPSLWDRLVGQIKSPRTLDEHRVAITGIYQELLGRVPEHAAAAA